MGGLSGGAYGVSGTDPTSDAGCLPGTPGRRSFTVFTVCGAHDSKALAGNVPGVDLFPRSNFGALSTLVREMWATGDVAVEDLPIPEGTTAVWPAMSTQKTRCPVS